MSQSETKTTNRGEFTRRSMPQARPWTKQTDRGLAIDTCTAWHEHKQAATWLEERPEPPFGPEAAETIRQAWLKLVAPALRRLCEGNVDGQVVLHAHCLECWVPLSPPEADAEALRLWSVAVNTAAHLVVVNETCTKVSLFVPLLQPTPADVELVDAALRYVEVELSQILEVLRLTPGLAAIWGQWVQAPQPKEGGSHRE